MPIQQWFVICVLLFSLPLIIHLQLLFSFEPSKPNPIPTRLPWQEAKPPCWFDLIRTHFIKNESNIKMGLVNFNDPHNFVAINALSPGAETVVVHFDRVDDKFSWDHLFPEWIDEDQTWGRPECPEIPMARSDDYQDLDVVVANVTCGINGTTGSGSGRDVFRLQVNLVVANLAVESGWVNSDLQRNVYLAFIGSCGPMVEIFRCEDLLMHEGDYWVYKPNLARLRHQMLMPFGSCQSAPAYAQTGEEVWRHYFTIRTNRSENHTRHCPRLAYATVLHTSEAYVCGAIALAQSIRLTNSTKDLVLRADQSITPKSIKGLKSAGWKVLPMIQRIPNPFARTKTHPYNKWNYSKLRIWQLTQYQKIIFLEADLLVLKNMDQFFTYPQLSASPNHKSTLFNSGFMVVEPSGCMFEDMMLKSFKVRSPYDEGDQGFLNEIFLWWHRLTSRVNHLKMFLRQKSNEFRGENVPEDVFAMHYLGIKPWMCYKDYDCNWDILDHLGYASDSAHRMWWLVYETMPKKLQKYCKLTKKMDLRIRKWRERARNASFPDGHWNIEVTDPRQYRYNESLEN